MILLGIILLIVVVFGVVALVREYRRTDHSGRRVIVKAGLAAAVGTAVAVFASFWFVGHPAPLWAFFLVPVIAGLLAGIGFLTMEADEYGVSASTVAAAVAIGVTAVYLVYIHGLPQW